MTAPASKIPRGIRNNNPCNIRLSDNPWRGKRTPSLDKEFEQFEHVAYGIRAAFCIIRTYLGPLHHLSTVPQVISRFAPSSENDTKAYTHFVCEKAMLSEHETLEFFRRSQMVRLVWAMACYECGRSFALLPFYQVYDWAFGSRAFPNDIAL